MDKKLRKIYNQTTPGTPFREGLDNILDAGTGALIVLDENENLEEVIDGGFEINCEYTPQRLHELSKMDGAIILDKTGTRIKYANIHLQANKAYTTNESGTRHRSAHRIAQETGNLVIAISERKKRITLYKGETQILIKGLGDLILEGNQAMKTFERYKYVLERALKNITLLEFDGVVTLSEVVTVLQRFEMLLRIKAEVEHSIIVLGKEGKFLEIQFEELLKGVLKEMEDFIRDYRRAHPDEEEKIEVESIKKKLSELDELDLLEINKVAVALGYNRAAANLDLELDSRGYRLLNKLSRVTRKDTEKIINTHQKLATILELDEEELMEIRGISKFKAMSIKKGIKRLKLTAELEK